MTAPTRSRERAPRGPNRRDALMRAAAELIAERGFDATSMRDIAAAVGMLPGSVYYYFPSKEDLFLAVHAQAVEMITAQVAAATAPLTDPWDRLEAACGAHLEALIGGGLVAIVSPEFGAGKAALRERLVAQRDAYETVFRDFVRAVPLAPGVERGVASLMLLGALNWTPTWYRAGGKSPTELGRAYVRMLRRTVDAGPAA